MTLIIIDTDILIDVGRGDDTAIECLRQLQQQSPPAISVVTQMELMIGCRNKAEASVLDLFYDAFKFSNLRNKFRIDPLNCSANIGCAMVC